MKVKIAFYIESLIVGGAEKVLIDLVNHMDPNRYDITVISIFKASVYDNYKSYFDNPFQMHVHFIWLVDNTNPFQYRWFNHCYAHLNKNWIYSLLVKDQYDIEVAFYEGLPTEFVSYSNNAKSKKYAWLHTDNRNLYEGKSDNYIRIKEQQYKKYDLVIGVSQGVCDSFSVYFPDIKTKTIYNYLDSAEIEKKSQEFFDRYSILKHQGPVFLSVGRLAPVKGYRRLIEAYGRLVKEGYSFSGVIVGEGEERSAIEDIIQLWGIEDYVFLEGMQSNPYFYMKNSDFLVCSSYAEGFGNTIAEAILCLTPVLSVNNLATRELFGKDCCGMICDNTDEGIFRMLKCALDHPEYRTEYVDSCQIRKAFFDGETRIKDYCELFDGECR